MVKADLHTHSIASPDGALTVANYRHILEADRLNVVAVTDHNRVDFAQKLQAELGDTIIVGEEITAQEGEVVGLFLQEVIPAGLSAQETADKIHEQGGLVYIPHPFETFRKGLPLDVLEAIADSVDIVETYNGRTMQNRARKAADWATSNQKPGVSSSDAHGRIGWGNTYTIFTEKPTRDTLMSLLATAEQHAISAGPVARLYPKMNRLKRRRS